MGSPSLPTPGGAHFAMHERGEKGEGVSFTLPSLSLFARVGRDGRRLRYAEGREGKGEKGEEKRGIYLFHLHLLLRPIPSFSSSLLRELRTYGK